MFLYVSLLLIPNKNREMHWNFWCCEMQTTLNGVVVIFMLNAFQTFALFFSTKTALVPRHLNEKLIKCTEGTSECWWFVSLYNQATEYYSILFDICPTGCGPQRLNCYDALIYPYIKHLWVTIYYNKWSIQWSNNYFQNKWFKLGKYYFTDRTIWKPNCLNVENVLPG